MKKITSIALLLLTINFGFGQTKIAELTFETAGGYTVNDPEFTDLGTDYFIRTDGSNISNEVFSNIQGSYYFAAQDTHNTSLVLPLILSIDDINIAGYSNIEFRVHLAEDDAGATQSWDSADYVHFNYDIDNTGAFNNLLWIENDGSSTNGEPLIDTDFDETGDGTAITDTFTQFTQSISGNGSLLDIQIVFRLDAGGEDIAIDNIEIWGTAVSCSPAVTWDGAAWDNVTGPDINTAAIIDGNYDTGTDGNLVACSLTINTGDRLTIDNASYVEVENDITVDGQLYIETQGSLVQNNNGASFTDNSTNGVRLRKTKTMQNALSYTYWSSPMSNETIQDALGVTPGDRRFRFDAASFVDTMTEIDNTNTFDPGPDDIDDDGDDWVLYTTGTMTAGVGYATTASEIVGPGGYPSTESFDFFGAFNNGTVTVALVNNSGGAYNDWNLIGNPYPGAIDVDQFFSTNSGLVDVVYLWDQATPPNGNTGGNENSNFSVDDYAIINGTGEIGARGDTGTRPVRYIASGQAFFVEALAAGNVVFNNAMRVTGNNTQFFKGGNGKAAKTSSSVSNKIWLNLGSDNGISNQILIGYVNGASKEVDATFYDAPRNLSPHVAAILYSNIENSDKKFAIQGKAPSDLNETEIISLGFKTTIDVATLYTISLADVQGNFLTSNTVYLKDNLLNKTHNLSASDYNFTSEVGEFNDRFEIAFSAQALSNDEFNLENGKLRIVELNDDLVQFTVPKESRIATVTIFDMLGRQLYNLKGANSSETYKLSKLDNTIFIAKVGLIDGTLITKKAIKK